MIKYLVILNIISFIIYGIDKQKSIKQTERISEFSLLFISLFAPLGASFGMHFFHHKTKKLKFNILIPSFLIIHFLVILKYFSNI